MFRNINGGGHLSGAQPSAASPSHPGGTFTRSEKQDTTWINVFSVVSRPAISFFQKYVPGLLQTRFLTDSIPDWVSEELKPTVSGEESSYLGLLGDRITERCQSDNVAGSEALKWLTADSFCELGIENAGEMDFSVRQPHIMGDFSRGKSLSHILLNSTLSIDATGSHFKSDCRSHTWWGGFWGSEEKSQSWLSKLSLGKGDGMTGAHCPPTPGGTKAAVTQTTALFVQCSSLESIPSERAGESSNKQEPTDKGSHESPLPESPKCSNVRVLQQRPNINETNVGTSSACNEVVVLIPDQDNGYSSLEEGHTLCQLHAEEGISNEGLKGAVEWKGDDGSTTLTEAEISEAREGPLPAARGMEKEEELEEGGIGSIKDDDVDGGDAITQEGPSAAASILTAPYCQNRAIAFIMGSPHSDDDADSLSNSELSDCDDGFDSEGSSDISDSEEDHDDDDDGSESDNGVDSETERLWASLCQTQDPYNPRNFTAQINTAAAVPQSIPSTSTASHRSPDSSPASSPDQVSSPISTSPASASALRNPDVWDDSTSASEAEEAENLHLWNSLSSSSDPYSLFHFQAPVRTQRPAEVRQGLASRGKKGLHNPHRSPLSTAASSSSSPQNKREEADDRLDSGFSEPPAHIASSSATSQGCIEVVKKVRFCEEVKEFFTSSNEDRRGPWEELARDRCRFLRRCHEVEQSIAYCLEPQHRFLAYQRLTVSYELASMDKWTV